MHAALAGAGFPVSGPHGRGFTGAGSSAVLLCVPDDAIPVAAAAVVAGPIVGHCSGVSPLAVLGAREGFSMHPLMTVTGSGTPAASTGATALTGATEVTVSTEVTGTTEVTGGYAAVAGSTPRALALAQEVAHALGLRPVTLADDDRAAYHAAASIASNFLVTLETVAAELMSTAGLERQVLVPLARAALDNWVRDGAAALTGPVARGDRNTVARQRAAVAERLPELAGLFDALVTATERIADHSAVPRPSGSSGGPGASEGQE